jgi:hypothetical protein
MAIKRNPVAMRLILLSFLITVFLLLSIILIGKVLDSKREEYLNNEFNKLYQDFNNLQTYNLLAESYDDKMACLAFESKLIEMDYYIWKLGEKIDTYRAVTEEFQKDPYYIEQKKIFNENEVDYMLLMKRMTAKCNISKQIIIFFYQNSDECKKCDDQSFILRDISLMEEDQTNKELATFSFDMDLNITTINLLSKYYKIDQYPCIIINEQKYCGIQDKQFIMNKVCQKNKNSTICMKYRQEQAK